MTPDPLASRLLEIIWDAASPATPHTAEVLAQAAREHIAAEITADRDGDPDYSIDERGALTWAARVARGGTP